MSSIIDVRGLTKSFNEITAVDDLTFTVKEKRCLRFFGSEWCRKIYHYPNVA